MSEDCPHCVFEKTEANCRGCFEGSHYKPKPITNADRLRAMSDEELAKWLDLLVNRAKIYGENKVWLEDTPRYYTDWLDWLKEASDEVYLQRRICRRRI